VESAFNPGPVIVAEVANALYRVLNIVWSDLVIIEDDLAGWEAGLGWTAKVHYDFDK
jgi:hypothetical protein